MTRSDTSRTTASYKSTLSVGTPRLPAIRSKSLTTSESETGSHPTAGGKKRRKTTTTTKTTTASTNNIKSKSSKEKSPARIRDQSKGRRDTQRSSNDSDPMDSPSTSATPSAGSKKLLRMDKNRMSVHSSRSTRSIRSINRQATSGNRENVPPTSRHSARHSSVPSDNRPRRDSLNEGMTNHCPLMTRVTDEQFIVDKYNIEKCLGQGNFAVVSRCSDNGDGSEWALKEIDINQLQGKSFCIENEAELMFKYEHKNICYLREAFQTPFTYYLVLEMAEAGDLFDAIKRDGPMKEDRVANIIGDSASALRYLHRNKVVHRDIKPENLLLTMKDRVKLTDFGLACRALGKLYRVCGTPTYVAPEILSEIGYGREVDMWSLGVIMHILLCGFAPFRSGDREQLFRLIKEGALIMKDKHWAHIHKDTKRIVLKMLQVDAEDRMTARQLLASKWMRRFRTNEPAESPDTSPKKDLNNNNNKKRKTVNNNSNSDTKKKPASSRDRSKNARAKNSGDRKSAHGRDLGNNNINNSNNNNNENNNNNNNNTLRVANSVNVRRGSTTSSPSVSRSNTSKSTSFRVKTPMAPKMPESLRHEAPKSRAESPKNSRSPKNRAESPRNLKSARNQDKSPKNSLSLKNRAESPKNSRSPNNRAESPRNTKSAKNRAESPKNSRSPQKNRPEYSRSASVKKYSESPIKLNESPKSIRYRIRSPSPKRRSQDSNDQDEVIYSGVDDRSSDVESGDDDYDEDSDVEEVEEDYLSERSASLV